MKIKNIQIESQNLDHLGLVSGMCDEIGLVDAIDNACGQQAKNKHLTYGECVKCMILNGLGFVGRTLYLYSEYFEDKPTDLLIGPSVKYQDIDDKALGRTLDRLFQLGVTELYTKIALAVVKLPGPPWEKCVIKNRNAIRCEMQNTQTAGMSDRDSGWTGKL